MSDPEFAEFLRQLRRGHLTIVKAIDKLLTAVEGGAAPGISRVVTITSHQDVSDKLT